MPSFQTLFFDPLCCQENHLWDAQQAPHPSSDIDDDLDDELDFLLNKEEQEILGFQERPDYFGNGVGRGEAVEWIFKVVECYSFSPLTGILAVNYLDRFLHELTQRSYKPWMGQLAAVACLSLAAKVEETCVPLLLDLQVEEETKYLFEPKTIQRMEILILSKLEWRMNPVTPLPFLHHIGRRLKLKGCLLEEFLRRSQFLLLYAVHDSRFMWQQPSAMATATMVYVMTTLQLQPSVGIQNQDYLMGILGIDKEKVKDCCRVIQEVATNSEMIKKRKMRSSMGGNGSPKGVIDMSFTYGDDDDDNTTHSCNSSPPSSLSVSSSPQHPLSKKIKSLTSDSTTSY